MEAHFLSIIGVFDCLNPAQLLFVICRWHMLQNVLYTPISKSHTVQYIKMRHNV